MQMMMRQQGSLYLAAALCASLEGRGARERLTLALRHYERALAPQLLAQAAVLPAMERCAAEARLELANFYLTWGTMSGGEQVKHLEAALSHARAPQKTEGLPIDVVAPLVQSIVEKVGNALSFLLVALVGRALGLVWKGFASVGPKAKRSESSSSSPPSSNSREKDGADVAAINNNSDGDVSPPPQFLNLVPT